MAGGKKVIDFEAVGIFICDISPSSAGPRAKLGRRRHVRRAAAWRGRHVPWGREKEKLPGPRQLPGAGMAAFPSRLVLFCYLHLHQPCVAGKV